MARVQDGRRLVCTNVRPMPEETTSTSSDTADRPVPTWVFRNGVRRFVPPTAVRRVQAGLLGTMCNNSMARGSSTAQGNGESTGRLAI